MEFTVKLITKYLISITLFMSSSKILVASETSPEDTPYIQGKPDIEAADLQEQYDKGYEAGYEKGYDEGYEKGFEYSFAESTGFKEHILTDAELKEHRKNEQQEELAEIYKDYGFQPGINA